MLWRQSAAQGNSNSQFNLALVYMNGLGVPRDYQEAIKWFRLSAMQGNAYGQNGLGWMYHNGFGVSQNYQEALKWYRLSEAQGNVTAQQNLASREMVAAAQQFVAAQTLSQQQNQSQHSFDDGLAAYNKGDYAGAIKILRPLAERGNPDAQGVLGGMHFNGDGVTQNYQEAVRWIRLAAEQGNAKAQYNLGVMYRDGQGIIQNYQEAMQWFRLAAAQGDATAQYSLGRMYWTTQGIQEALKWFHLAAAQGYVEAQALIGILYYIGEEVPKNHQEALKWLRLAAAQGSESAKEALESPEMVASAKNATGQIQYQQPQRLTSNRTQTQKKTSASELIFESSTPSSDGSIELSGRVTSSASISEVSINGRALEVPLAKDGSFKVVRRLPMGVTTYRLSVVDEFDQRADAEVTVERAAIQYAEEVAPLNPGKLKAKVNPNAVALIIGIEAYSRLPQAQYADSDASHFYDYANQALGVPANKIKLLTDAKANRIDLLLAMRSWMKAQVIGGKSDVYIFFAGHGLASADGDKTYLLPADGDRDFLDETSILRDDLIASAKGAKTITLFLDTCYSGGTRTTEVLLADARPIAIVPDKSNLPPNVTVLAASSGAQLSSTYEAAQQGLFSYWLMKGLEGDADANGDRKITTGELHDYVAKQVGPMAQRRNRQQDPQLIGDSARVLVSY